MKKPPTKTHGGKRPGAGRKPKFGEPMVRLTASLTHAQAETAKSLGDGDVPSGIRVALDLAAHISASIDKKKKELPS